MHYDDLPRLMRLMTADPATSTLDVLWVLYDRILRVSPETADAPDRDRFVLSKGHAPEAYYAVLAAKGFFPEEWLNGYAGVESRLGGHPDRVLVPGVEFSSGSLGHGLPAGVGMAHGLRAQGNHGSRVVVLVGDAELDEGSNHEATAYAGSVALSNLTVVVIDNKSATYPWPGGLENAFPGWDATTVDGRDHQALEKALSATNPEKPTVVIAKLDSYG